jgi:hypothetical protein
MTHAFSVDVEDWYQVSDFEEVVESRRGAGTRAGSSAIRSDSCPSSRKRVKATFFVLAWNAERHPALPRMIAAAGHEVATHGYAHRLAYEVGAEAFRADVERSKKPSRTRPGARSRLPGAVVLDHRARSLWALDVLLDSASATTRAFSRCAIRSTASRTHIGSPSR